MERNLRTYIEDILHREIGSDVPFSVERQEMEGRGDYSSNIALVRAKVEKRLPMAVAEDIASRIKEKHLPVFSKIEAAAPGFLNFYFDKQYLIEILRDSFVSEPKLKLGTASVEYISANPTGPMHIGNARSGPIGDVVANLLADRGYKVVREYFHNDAGAQIGRFADSLWHWYMIACGEQSVLAEDGYQGEYIQEMGKAVHKKYGAKILKKPDLYKERITKVALASMLKDNLALAKRMGIVFDKVVAESDLEAKTKRALALLDKKGLLTKKEGAVWFTPKDDNLGERESVVIKSDGTYVYFAGDIAYHAEKFKRADLVVDELGENHEGHVPKLRAIADAFDFLQKDFKVVVHGQVTLKKDGQVVSMAKRKGNFVTAEELLDTVGKDAFRFFMLQYAPRSAMTFDMDLARAKSKDNPVYYIQYAHARASSILKKAGYHQKRKINYKKVAWPLLDTEAEWAIIRMILALPDVINQTAEDFQLQRLSRFALDFARAFTHFYETTHVIGERADLEYARLALVSLFRETMQRQCKLMGISTPDTM
ncbi:MAG: arginine--tRNA ligase [Patescibacteria group bacterium]